MNAVVAILAGGLATRLGSLTADLPKALIPINGRPFIEYQLDLLAGMGFSDVVVCTGHKGDLIEEHLGSLPLQINVRFSHDGDILLGTGGALMKAVPLLGERFVIIYGDSYLEGDYASILRYFDDKAGASKPSPLGLMTVFKNSKQFDTSNVLFRDGSIIAYNKREPTQDMDYIDWGLGILHKAAFDAFRDTPVFDLARVYEDLVARRLLLGFEVSRRFFEIGSFQGIRDFEAYMNSKAPDLHSRRN